MSSFRVFPLEFIAQRLRQYARVDIPDCAGRFVRLDLSTLERTLFGARQTPPVGVGIKVDRSEATIEFHYEQEDAPLVQKLAQESVCQDLTFQEPIDPSFLVLKRPTFTTQSAFKDLGLSILLVEDNHEIGRLIDRMSSRAGIDCHWCESAQEAVNWEHSFDLLITDLNLTECSGSELLAQLRLRGYHGPALFISGDPEHKLETAASSAGPGVAYLQKPFQLNQLFHHSSILLSGECPRAGLTA